MRKFGISMPQASADLQRFQKDNPDAMEYDPSSKRYVAGSSSRGEQRRALAILGKASSVT